MNATPHGDPLTDDSCAQAALTYLAEPADRWLSELIRVHRAARALDAIKSGRLPRTGGHAAVQRAMERWRVRLDELPKPSSLTRCLRSVAMVGSRAATAYGSYVAAEFAASVAARCWAVISGGA